MNKKCESEREKVHVPRNGGAGKRLKIWLSHIKLMDQPMALKVKILHPSMYSFIIVKKELDDSTQALRNWPLKMWRPKDRSMTVLLEEKASINGVVVTWVVAIDPPGVRFPLNA